MKNVMKIVMLLKERANGNDFLLQFVVAFIIIYVA